MRLATISSAILWLAPISTSALIVSFTQVSRRPTNHGKRAGNNAADLQVTVAPTAGTTGLDLKCVQFVPVILTDYFTMFSKYRTRHDLHGQREFLDSGIMPRGCSTFVQITVGGISLYLDSVQRPPF